MADKSIWTEAQAGPASYSAGGIVVTTTLASVEAMQVNISVPGANLGQVDFDPILNSPGAGQVTLKVLRRIYRKTTALGNLLAPPTNVTVRTTSGGTYTAVSHVHAFDHDHPAATSSTPTAGGGGAVLLVGGINLTTHTHTFNIPAFTGNVGAEATHGHTWNSLYEHQHSVTNTATDGNIAEITAGTDLSGATLNLLAIGTV